MGADDGEGARRALILPALVFAYFSSLPSLVLTSILLVDMGESFGQPVGVMAQMQTLSSLVGTLSAFAVGVLCVRYNAKALLLAGLAVLGLSALGCGSAPTLSILLIFYALTGLGMAMVDPMVGALTADNFDVDERARVIGLTGAGGGLSYILGSLVIGYVASVSGWRTAFLGYAMVLPLLGALLSHVALPSTGKPPSGGGGAIEGFREIYSNRSAMACLLGNLLTSAMAQGIYVYSFSFLRERFMVAPGWTGVVSSAASVLFLLGSVASGWLIERHGRKRVAVVGALLLSVITLYTRLPILWISVASIVVGHFFGALRFSANNSLSLEQVPDYRGSMMSMNSAAYRIGGALGTGLGGIVLVLHGWETLGAALALVGISGMLVYHLLSVDPVETQQMKDGPA